MQGYYRCQLKKSSPETGFPARSWRTGGVQMGGGRGPFRDMIDPSVPRTDGVLRQSLRSELGERPPLSGLNTTWRKEIGWSKSRGGCYLQSKRWWVLEVS